MSIIICDNSKNYSLTVNNEYIILDETKDFYHIENDKSKIAKYSKELFSKKELVVPIAPVAPKKPKVIPPHNFEDIKKSIKVSLDIDDDDPSFELEYVNEKNVSITYNTSMRFYDSNISCGILQLTNLNGCINDIVTFVNKFRSNIR